MGQLATHADDPRRSKQHYNEIRTDIATIKAQLTELLGRQAKLEIQNDAKLPPQALVAVLPDVRAAVTTLRDQNLKVHAKDIDDLSQNLAALPDKDNN